MAESTRQVTGSDGPRDRSTPDGAATCGQLLRRYRRLAGLTQEEFAERSAYSANYISKLERDQRQPSAHTVAHLAAILGLDPDARQALLDARTRQRIDPRDPVRTPLAGRLDELARIKRHLAGLGPPVLLLTGEPGIGKTRLLREATALATASGWRVVQGSCRRRDEDPYAPLSAALASSLQQLAPPDRVAALAGCAWLGWLLPELSDLEPLPSLPPGQQRRLLAGALDRYLHTVAGPDGTLLLLDDLQWAGADALALLAALVSPEMAEVGPSPLRVLAAYRDTDLPPEAPLLSLVADLARDALVTVHALPPLSEAESASLLDALAPARSRSGYARRWPKPRLTLVDRDVACW